MSILLFIAGLLLLIVGANALVKGASRLAAAFRVAPLIIGLTVVAFGTSAPELAVSIKAALVDQADIAIGNVVGSNIFNVLFILGISALITPLVVSAQLIRLDVPLMVALSALTIVMALDGTLSRIDGLLFVSILIGYVLYLIRQSRRDTAAANAAAAACENPEELADAVNNPRWLLNLGLVFGGLALLVLGSRWLVESAIAFAQYLGVSELVIGLTIVAAGTSMPEVVTSIVAALRGERDIAVGNVVGSNIFNLMCVLGVSSVVAPSGIAVADSTIAFDLPIMLAVAFACLPIFLTEGVISRWEGGVLLGYYLLYTTYLIFASTHHDLLNAFSAMLVWFVLPLTTLTILVTVVRDLRRRRRRQRAD
jgi:cation:H+ antiporter